MTGDKLAGVERDAQRLYDLIWRQFVACQMTPAEYLSSTLTVEASNVELKAKGRTLVFDGFTRVRGANKSDDDVLLPAVKVGEVLKLEKLDPSQHFTKPPARFTEASLVKELEKKALVVHRHMLRLFQRFKIVATLSLKIAVYSLRKWVKSLQIV